MIRGDQPPYGEAISLNSILDQLRQWKYPVRLGGPLEPLTLTSVVAGGSHACALTAKGLAYCWGGAPGNGSYEPRSRMTRIVGRLRFKMLSAGRDHTCGITTSGEGYCWGINIFGELGEGSQETVAYGPLAVSGGLSFKTVSGGLFATCGLTSKDLAYCWGSQDRHVRVPAQLSGGLHLISLAVSSSTIVAVTRAGAAYVWGANDFHKLGYGPNDNSEPVALKGDRAFVSITTDRFEGSVTCATTQGGEAHCWGQNSEGELGNGTGGAETLENDSDIPVLVAGNHKFVSLSAGYAYVCGLTASGDAYCWGRNERGQLGNGTSKKSNVPVKVSGGLKFLSVAAGFDSTCGVTRDGSAYCWGNNDEGQLGSDTKDFSSIPVAATK